MKRIRHILTTAIVMLFIAAALSCGDDSMQIDMIRGKYAVKLGDYSDLAKITVKYLSGSGNIEAVVGTSDKLQVFDDIEMAEKTQPFMPFAIGGYLFVEPKKDAIVDENKTYYFPYYFEIDFHGYYEGACVKGADYNVRKSGILSLKGSEIRQIIDNYVDRGPDGLLIYCIDRNGVMTKAILDGGNNSSGSFGKIVLGGKKNSGNASRGTRKINSLTADTNNYQQ
ncbi:MAG: hypothetical protein IJS19_09500 [Muribaculaceae bacterium]|nr:hypothetical protein [Muribaculaceae bacterium]